MLRYSLLILAAVLLSSCVKSSEHEELMQRVASLEQFRNETKRALKADLARAENLSNRLKEAAKDLRKGGADINVRLDDHDQANRRVRGRLEELEFLSQKLADKLQRIGKFLDTRMGFSIIDLPKDLPQTPDGLLTSASAAFEKKDLVLARAIVRKFMNDFGNHEGRAQALFLMGETYRQESKFKPALKAYEEVWVHHKNHPVTPKALLSSGHALRDSNECKKAMQMYRLLTKTFRKTPEATRAKEIYKDLKQSCK